MFRLRFSACPERARASRGAAWVLALVALTQTGAAQQAPAQPPAQQPAPPPAEAQEPAPPRPTFRGGIDFVRVDVIVTDNREQPITTLTEADFEISEDGKPQKIEQFRLVKVDGQVKPGDPPPREIRSRADEELEANREDVRVYAILLDDYHVRLGNSMTIREPLTQFIRTQLRPHDLIAVMYPLTPVRELTFTRNHESIIKAINQFEGRKFDYTPKNQVESQYVRYSTDVIERIRNDVVMGALEGLSVRLGSLREGRKSLIFVSEGLTALLPPQMQRESGIGPPQNPRQQAAAAQAADSDRQINAEFHAQNDLMSRLREVYDTANRNNTSIYALDPRGLAPFEYAIDDVSIGAALPSFSTDRRSMQLTQDTLRVLAEETDGRAIVNRNTLLQGLTQIVKDSSYYYLIGYNSSLGRNDGKFHEIKVRVKRSGAQVRARKGYWAMTAADVERAATPTPDVARPVQQALASIATSVQSAKPVRTWIGTERGTNGKTRVTLIWEPVPAAAGSSLSARREQPGRINVLAADAKGDLVFRGRTPDAALASASPAPERNGAPSAPAATAPQRLVFEAPPGKLELRLTVEAAGTGATIDQETRTIDVPDLTAPDAAISTPRIFRARNAREFQLLNADAEAVPMPGREFSRTERLLIRFDSYGPGTERPEATAVLLNRAGTKMADVPVQPAVAAGTHQIDLGLAAVPAGEYLVEITVKTGSGEVKELVPFRVRS